MVVVMPMIMIIVISVSAIMFAPVTVVMVFAVPMAFMHPPAFAVVVVMRMRPVSSFIRRLFPTSLHPSIVAPLWLPISLNPNIALVRHRPRFLISNGRRRTANAYRNLRRGRCHHCCRRGYCHCEYPMQPHYFYLLAQLKFATSSGEIRGGCCRKYTMGRGHIPRTKGQCATYCWTGCGRRTLSAQERRSGASQRNRNVKVWP